MREIDRAKAMERLPARGQRQVLGVILVMIFQTMDISLEIGKTILMEAVMNLKSHEFCD